MPLATDAADLPSVLVVCEEPLNGVSGGGVTMASLFRGWPQDRIAQIWSHRRFSVDERVCSRHYRIGGGSERRGTTRLNFLRRWPKVVEYARSTFRAGIRLPEYSAVTRWARAVAPDVVYSQATPYPMYSWWLPRWLSRDLRIPLVNHVMDDWPGEFPRRLLPGYREVVRHVMCTELAQLFRTGSKNLAICAEMAVVLEQRYGTPFVPFNNMIDLADWRAPKADYGTGNGSFRLVYVGALSPLTQIQSLQDVAYAVSDLLSQGVDLSLTVHAGEMYFDWYERFLGGIPGVSYGGRIARANLCAVLAAADALVLPVNFGDEGALVRYSMPTKVPEYMASGSPILVYGPADVPPVAYASRSQWGYVVSDRSRTALEQGVLALSVSQSLRRALGVRARALAMRDHSADVLRPRFAQLMRDVAWPNAL